MVEGVTSLTRSVRQRQIKQLCVDAMKLNVRFQDIERRWARLEGINAYAQIQGVKEESRKADMCTNVEYAIALAYREAVLLIHTMFPNLGVSRSRLRRIVLEYLETVRQACAIHRITRRSFLTSLRV